MNEQTVMSRLSGSWELAVKDSVEVSLEEGFVSRLPGVDPRQELQARFERVGKTSSFEVQGSEFIYKYGGRVISRVPVTSVKSEGALHVLELDLKGECFKDENKFEIEFLNIDKIRKKWLKFKDDRHNASEVWKRLDQDETKDRQIRSIIAS